MRLYNCDVGIIGLRILPLVEPGGICPELVPIAQRPLLLCGRSFAQHPAILATSHQACQSRIGCSQIQLKGDGR